MSDAYAISLVLAALAGVLLGAIGAGGTLVALPIFTHVLELPASEAATGALIVVLATSIGGTIAHARAKRVEWRAGVALGVTSAIAAFVTARFARGVDHRIVMTIYILVLVAGAFSMFRKRPEDTGEAPKLSLAPPDRSVARIAAVGVLVGLVTGLAGVGGGFLLVPVLERTARLPIERASATSLAIIAVNSAAGLAGHASEIGPQVSTAAPLAGAALLGLVVGIAIAPPRTPRRAARTAVGVLLAGLALFLTVSTLRGV